ncbi:MAG: hypothetical protein JWM81_878 [Candidatus Saccharibacteria bacterium]|nr:hypothetical protein [Candidatus Saccharibacteria bacterium]
MHSSILPGFAVAGPNARLLHTDTTPEVVHTNDGQRVVPSEAVLAHLNDLRIVAKEVSPVTPGALAPIIPEEGALTDQITSWKQLNEQTYAPYQDLWGCYKDALRTNDTSKAKRLYAARAAIGTMAALLEVTATIAPLVNPEKADDELAGIAMASRGLLTAWYSLSGSSDSSLTFHLLRKPRPRIPAFDNEEQKFLAVCDMHFEPSKFAYIGGHVTLDPAILPRFMRGKKKKFAMRDAPNAVIFGCPAHHIVPALHGTMVESARVNQLFSQTYQATH